MKIIDRYLVVTLVLPFLFCCASLYFVFVVIDLFDNVSDLVHAHSSLWNLVLIYLVLIPQVAPVILPFAFFLSCVYVLSNLSAHKELVAMMSAGLSLARLSIPFFLLALVVSFIQYLLLLDLSPTAESRREVLIANLQQQGKSPNVFKSIIYKNPQTGTMWYIHEIDIANGTLKQAEIVLPDELGRDKVKYFVAQGQYRGHYWDFVGIRKVEFKIDGNSLPPVDLSRLDAYDLTEPPEQMVADLKPPEESTWPDLYRFINARYQPPANRMAPYKTEHYNRTAYPLLAPVLCLFAFALSIVHDRKSRTGAVFNCIVVLIVVFIFQKVSIGLGNGTRLSPFMAGWSPILVFGAAGLAMFAAKVGWTWEAVSFLRTSGYWPDRNQN
ncbi:MAG: LptF/LptG family permease [Methylacidiphilales bacterium]|nr:LptF/LptG family permease [Candidatus Methylacidiphilales bacterium]